MIDPQQGELLATIKTGGKPHGVAIAPDGKTVYVSNEADGTLSFIDPARNEVIGSIPVGIAPNQIITSADGRHVFVALNTNGLVAVVSAAERKIVKEVPVGRGPHIMMRRPDGKKIYVTSEGDMKLVEFDAESWEVTGETELLAWPRVLAQTLDGKKVYQTIRWLNGALVIDPVQKKVIDRIALGEPKFAVEGMDAHGLGVTPNGKELWIATQTTGEITILSTSDHSILERVSVGRSPNWVEFTPDGALAVVSNTGSDDVSIVDVAKRKVVHTVRSGTMPKRLNVGLVEMP